MIMFVVFFFSETTFLLCRYKIKLEVFDDTDSGNFMLFNSDVHQLIKKSCKDMLADVKVYIRF